MAAPRPRIRVPKRLKKGQIGTIKTLISHQMETGLRKDKETGLIFPRKIINKFEVTMDGKPVFRADIHPAISANPYFTFTIKPEKSGTLEFVWTDDDGSVYKRKAKIEVV